MEHFSNLFAITVGWPSSHIFDHFLFLLATEEMCQSSCHKKLQRLVLEVENQILQDDHEVCWIAIQCSKISPCNVWAFQIILPTDDGFYSDGISIKLCVLPAMSKIRYCFVKHSILFFFDLVCKKISLITRWFISPSNFGLKTTLANKFDKGDQACSIGLYAEYLVAYVDTERRSKFSSWKSLK